jgi:hypothetical protein
MVATSALRDLLDAVLSEVVSSKDVTGLWSNERGSLSVGAAGYKSISDAADVLNSESVWSTYPRGFLMRVVAHALIDEHDDTAKAIDNIEARLNSGLGHQRALVPFWGFHLIGGLEMRFGPYLLTQLGERGYEKEVLDHVRLIRSEMRSEEVDEEVAYARKHTAHIANVPVLIVKYHGGGEGAADLVDPIAEHVGEFMQFATGGSTNRNDVKIIDHRGDHFGRFTSIMPVVSDEPALQTLNLRGNPYGAKFGPKEEQVLRQLGVLDLLSKVPAGPSEGKDVDDMLLRAIQLLADAERATSQRLAMVGYIGACDVLFGKRDDAQRYTCTGMALAVGGDFARNYALASEQYEKRSRSVHQGFSPEELIPARRFAYSSILYVSERRSSLTGKKAIRNHIDPHVPPKASA